MLCRTLLVVCSDVVNVLGIMIGEYGHMRGHLYSLRIPADIKKYQISTVLYKYTEGGGRGGSNKNVYMPIKLDTIQWILKVKVEYLMNRTFPLRSIDNGYNKYLNLSFLSLA